MIRMPKTVLILLGVIIYFCIVLVRIENQRYALWMGLCHSPYVEVFDRDVSPRKRSSKRRGNVSAKQKRVHMLSGTSGTLSWSPIATLRRQRGGSDLTRGHAGRANLPQTFHTAAGVVRGAAGVMTRRHGGSAAQRWRHAGHISLYQKCGEGGRCV